MIQRFDPLTAGLLLTVEPLSVTVFSIIGGWLADRTGSRDPAIAGMGIVAASLFLLSTTSQGSTIFFVAFLLGMLGAGVGIFAPGNTNANLGSVPPQDRARANGILGMMRHTGQRGTGPRWSARRSTTSRVLSSLKLAYWKPR